MVMTRSITVLFCLLALPGVAGAQNPQPAAPHETHAPVAAPNSPLPPPEQIAPGGRSPSVAGDDKNLSDKLSRQQGMLQPPKVDPGIQAPVPPQAGHSSMPVIPPPGSRGGDQKVVPK